MNAEQTKEPICSICGETLASKAKNPRWLKGNNAMPINDGRCCDVCETLYVLPERVKQFVAQIRGLNQ